MAESLNTFNPLADCSDRGICPTVNECDGAQRCAFASRVKLYDMATKPPDLFPDGVNVDRIKLDSQRALTQKLRPPF